MVCTSYMHPGEYIYVLTEWKGGIATILGKKTCVTTNGAAQQSEVVRDLLSPKAELTKNMCYRPRVWRRT